MVNESENIDEEEIELVESALDDNTHAEMLALYRESTRTILFAKTRQWRTLGAACIAHVTIVAIGHLFSLEESFHQILVILSFLVSSMAICILIIYQIWQHTEAEKIRKVTTFLSNYFLLVRQVKGRGEANIHRYILLVVMIISIIVANSIAYFVALPTLPI